MITRGFNFFKDISRFECRNSSEIYKVLIDPNHFFNRGRHLLPKTSLAVSYLCQMYVLLLACPLAPLPYVAGDALPCLKAMIVVVATMVCSRVPGSLETGSGLAAVTQSTTGLFPCSLSMCRWKERDLETCGCFQVELLTL